MLLGTTLFIPIDQTLYNFDAQEPNEPTLLWQRTMPDVVLSLATDQENLYVGLITQTPEGNIHKLDPADGTSIWQADVQRFELGAIFALALAIEGERVITYTAENNGALQAFDRITGERLWTNPLNTCSDGTGFLDHIEFGGGKAYVSPRAGSCLFAVDLATGKEAWTLETRDGPDGAISIGGKPLNHKGVLYTSVERLWAVDAETGKVLSYAREPAYNTTGTILHYADGEVLVWGDDLTAYKPIRD